MSAATPKAETINDVRNKLDGMRRSRDKWKAAYLELTAAIVRAGGLPKPTKDAHRAKTALRAAGRLP